MLKFFGGDKKSPKQITLSGLKNRPNTTFVGLPNESILLAAEREGLKLPHKCRVGGCGTCKCQLVNGDIKRLTDFSYVLTKEELDSGVILACQSVPKTDVMIERILRQNAPATTPTEHQPSPANN